MPSSIGQQLSQARQKRGLSIEEVAHATRIRPHYLRALEEEDHHSLPSSVQGRGFLRNYAAYLGIDAKPLLALWEGKSMEPEPSGLVASQPDEAIQVQETLPPKSDIEAIHPVLVSSIETPSTSPSLYRHTVLPTAYPMDKPTLPTPAADEIMKEIGQVLRAQRELLSLSLAEIERYTHIRVHYLEALEKGNLNELPSPTQARGMLNNYARFINLDTDVLLNRFADALILRRKELSGETERTEPLAPVVRPGRFSRMITMDLLVVGSLFIGLFVFAAWAISQVMSASSTPAPTGDQPSVAEVLLASPRAESGSGIATSSPTPAGTLEISSGVINATGPVQTTLLPVGDGTVQVYVVASRRVWMQVTVDGKVQFTGRTNAGGAYPFSAEERIELTTGNAAGLQIYLNQQDIGTLGSLNEVAHVVFLAEGMVAPTATVTPTITRTPRQSPTPATTTTPRPTN